MAVAASVKTIIKLEGQDNASRAVNKASSSVGRLNRAVQSAQSSFGRMGQAVRSAFSGDVAGAVGNVSGMLGSAGGMAGAAAAAAAGTAALGAAVAVAAYKFTEWSVEIERTRAALDSTFGTGKGVETAIGFARAIGGVGVDSVAKLATTLKATGLSAQITAAQMQELTARATTMGKSGDEALTAFARAIQTGNTRALQQVGTFINAGRVLDEYAKAAGKTTTELTQYEKQVAVLAAVQESLDQQMGSTSTTFARQDDVLARLSVAWTDFKFQLSEVLAGPAAGILETLAEAAEAMARFGRVAASVAVALGTTFTANTRAAGIALGGMAAAAATLASGGSLKTAVGLLERASDDAVASGIGKSADAWRKVYDEISKGSAKVRAVQSISTSGGLKKYLADVDAAIRLTDKMIERADAAIKKSAARRGGTGRKTKADPAIAAAIDAERAHADALDEVDKINREAAASTRSLEDARLRIAALQAGDDLRAKMRVDLMRVELQLQRDIARVRASAVTEQQKQAQIAALRQEATLKGRQVIATADKVAADIKRQAHEQEMRQIKEAADARAANASAAITEAFEIANAGVDAVEQLIGANRVLAGVRAAIFAAEAAFSFASGHIPAGIAKTAAAINMARQAFAAAPTVSKPSAPSGSAGGGISGPAPSSGGGAAPVFNIVLNGVMTTRAEVGAAIDKATKAAKMAGMAGA
jgi:hypothetical protein